MDGASFLERAQEARKAEKAIPIPPPGQNENQIREVGFIFEYYVF